jgi:hypothetical protein
VHQQTLIVSPRSDAHQIANAEGKEETRHNDDYEIGIKCIYRAHEVVPLVGQGWIVRDFHVRKCSTWAPSVARARLRVWRRYGEHLSSLVLLPSPVVPCTSSIDRI